MPPASAADRDLHQRLVDGDPTAPAELAESHLGPLAAGLDRRFPGVDQAILWNAAVDVVLALPQHPEKYDPDRLGLQAYLLMDADGDVRNRRQSEGRRLAHLTVLDPVEHLPPPRNIQKQGLDDLLFPDDEFELPPGLNREETLMELRRALPDDADRQALALMADGERRTSVFAAVWSLGQLDGAEQRRAVKRNKDRVQKVVERLRKRLLAGARSAKPAGKEGRDAAW